MSSMYECNKCLTKLVPLTLELLNSAHRLFVRNHKRLADDAIVDLWVDVPETFFEAFEDIILGLTNSQAYVILKGHEVIGFIDSGNQGSATRIGYVIDQQYEGQGIMRQHLAEAIQNMPRPVEARIHIDNTRSAAIATRLNFIRLDDSLQNDHYIWQLV